MVQIPILRHTVTHPSDFRTLRMLDLDEDGLLQQRELRGLADLMGFDGSDADWAQQYQQLCADMKVQKSQAQQRMNARSYRS